MGNETSAAPGRGTLAAFALLGLLMAGAAYGADEARPPAKLPPRASAEVQINLCGEPGQIAKALAMRADSRRREVWYFDTRTLALFDRGAVFRLRVGDGPAELTLKAARQDWPRFHQRCCHAPKASANTICTAMPCWGPCRCRDLSRR
jgi:hypothetical protein